MMALMLFCRETPILIYPSKYNVANQININISNHHNSLS
jgi:hypothetical protein